MPDIEGVPYETTGTALDQATAQALAARGREWADAGISAANAATAAANESKALSQSVIAEVGTIRTSVAQAAASASASATSASRAQSTSDALVPRMEQIETLAGLAPGEVTDAQTANLITQPDTSTRDALDAASVQAGAKVFPLASDEVPDPTAHSLIPEAARVLHVDARGRRYRSPGSGILERQDTPGGPWRALFTFPRAVTALREMDNGEILVSVVTGGTADTRSRLYVSADNAGTQPTFTHRLTASGNTAVIQLKWSGIGANGVYPVNEYDPATPGTRASTQKAWLTTDAGATWAEIYDHGTGSPGARHIHGIIHDPYRDALWLSLGDFAAPGDGNRGLKVSWDRGASWTTVSEDLQPTAIWALPNAVLLGSDNAPNAMLRIDDPSPASLVPRVAHRLNLTNRLTHVAEAPFQAATPGAPVLFPYSPSLSTEYGVVLATFDGVAYWELWRDTTPNRSPIQAFQTSEGYLVSGLATSGGFHVEVAEGTRGLTSTVSRQTSGIARQRPERSYVLFANQAGQSVPHNTWTEVGTTGRTWGQDDHNRYGGGMNPSGLFKRHDTLPGVVVTRDAIVDVHFNPGVNPFTFGTLTQVSLAVDGTRFYNAPGGTLSARLPVKAGSRISGFVIQQSGNAQTLNGSAWCLGMDSIEV